LGGKEDFLGRPFTGEKVRTEGQGDGFEAKAPSLAKRMSAISMKPEKGKRETGSRNRGLHQTKRDPEQRI